MLNRPLILWLGLVCAMIFIMALIGAVTRLTESGLSITRWEPVRGAIPPLNIAEWQKAYSLYKATPQYRAIHRGMTLREFKTIYFWEWLHRLWGRLIGLVYAAGLAFFWLRGRIPRGYKAPLLLALALGGLQGFIGWFMVQSGLQEGMAAVSPYRLALHLGLALVLYAWLYVQILRLWPADVFPEKIRNDGSLRLHAWMGFGFLCLAILWGVFTAGLNAGKIYNSFPLMGGHILPPDFSAVQPWWRNIFENPAAVQFLHRLFTLSAALLLFTLALQLYPKLTEKIRRIAVALGFFSLLQPVLGIATLLSGVSLGLAVAHQAGAILLLTTTLSVLYALRPGRKTRLPEPERPALRPYAG